MTRSVLIFAVILISCQISAHAYGDLRPFLERFKNVMKTGNESLGIPIYDPYDSKEETFHVEISYVLADLNLKDLYMTGLSEYQIKKGTYTKNGLHVEIAFRWEEIVTETKYDIDGVLADKYPIYGKGNLTGIIKGLDVTCVVDIALGFDGLKVQEIKSTVQLESLDVGNIPTEDTFKITGLFNNENRSKVLSKLVSLQAPGMIRKHPKQAGQIMSDVTEKKINEIIANLSVKDIFDLIKE